MKVVHVLESLRKEEGGIAATIPWLSDALAESGVSSEVVALATDEGTQFRQINGNMTSYKQNLKNLLGDTSGELVIHCHGLWAPLMEAAARLARDLNLPYVVSTHGMLLPWARNHKKVRKDLAWWLYQRETLQGSRYIHVTSEDERAELTSFTRVKVIPFGVAIPQNLGTVAPADPKTLLFLGRIHPIKNLESLLQAWSQKSNADWQLKIVGPGDASYINSLKQLAHRLCVSNSVEFSDAVFDHEKWRLIQSSTALVLPSYSENFGAVVVESLACGRPVVTSQGTPWSHLVAEGCGFEVDTTVAGLRRGIDDLISLDDTELIRMGHAGKAYARREHDWIHVAERFLQMYRSVFSSP